MKNGTTIMACTTIRFRALEGVGGNNAFSESNTIELIQSPIVDVPNAYTPNGDNTKRPMESCAGICERF
jgi:hypothetical protein